MATIQAEPKFDPSTLLNDGPESNFAHSPEPHHRFGTLGARDLMPQFSLNLNTTIQPAPGLQPLSNQSSTALGKQTWTDGKVR